MSNAVEDTKPLIIPALLSLLTFNCCRKKQRSATSTPPFVRCDIDTTSVHIPTMKLQKPYTDTEWEEIATLGPGERIYKGKKTLFYNGEKFFEVDEEDWEERPFVYNEEQRQSWEVIIVLPGVKVIPEYTFNWCKKVETIIMNDTVKRIEDAAFNYCESLLYVTFSTNLEYIGLSAFLRCESLISVFIPPSCKEIDHEAFKECEKLIIFHVPQHTALGENVIGWTALLRASPFEDELFGTNMYIYSAPNDEVYEWIKNINDDTEEYSLHRACSSYYPTAEFILGIVKKQGLKAFQKQNKLGITPLQYLVTNPYADINQSAIIKRYVLEMMGEIA